MLRMFANIEPFKAAIVSIISASMGTIHKNLVFNIAFMNSIPVDTALQRLAWTVAILAGIVAIINGSICWFKKRKEKEV